MIELQDVHKTYDTGTIALNGISMKIDDGEFVFLVGPSGSGKSTIIKILTAELRPDPPAARLSTASPSKSFAAVPCRICAGRSALSFRISASSATNPSMKTSRLPCA